MIQSFDYEYESPSSELFALIGIKKTEMSAFKNLIAFPKIIFEVLGIHWQNGTYLKTIIYVRKICTSYENVTGKFFRFICRVEYAFTIIVLGINQHSPVFLSNLKVGLNLKYAISVLRK